MNKTYVVVALVVCALVAGGAAVYFSSGGVQEAPPTEYRGLPFGQDRIERPDLGLSFAYQGGENGLSLIEPPAVPGQELLQAFILFPTSEYIEFQQAEEGREAPAGITIFVYEEPEPEESIELSRQERLEAWATERSGLTSYTRAISGVETVDLDGLNALFYQADGLYRQDIYLASYRGRIYVFIGQYNETDDFAHTTFKELMSTVTFD